MFTGIIEDIGTLTALTPAGEVVKLQVQTALDLSDTKLGDSIAINGVCLTVTELAGSLVAFDVGPESLAVTALGRLAVGDRVHMERALRLSDRLGGHLVQGHVDGVGTLAARTQSGDTLQLTIACPPQILALSIQKGSIALDGVSLTINALDDETLSVWLIPHTLEQTVLGERKVGDPINIESDLIGKYVARLLGGRPKESGVTWELLAKSGFLGGER